MQARTKSSRLPGKIFLEIGGAPSLHQQIRRLRAATSIDDIIIATSTEPADDSVVTFAEQVGVACYRGSERDVLRRFVGAAREAAADMVVRVTGDCPLIDPAIADMVVGRLLEDQNCADYASNVLRRTFPRGLDVEAFFFDTLLRMDRIATSESAREHVTTFLRSERPDLFSTLSIEDQADNSDLRWTLDTEADLTAIRNIYQALQLDDRIGSYHEIVQFVRQHPEISAINADERTWTPIMKRTK